MVKKAAAYMNKIGAEFVFTGEVLGQRPMSQRRKCLDLVENDAGIAGRLLRPLSARLLAPTIPENEGIVDRSKLLDISGRSRKTQLAFVKKHGITGFSTPGGGCLLTEKVFGARLRNVLSRGCPDIASTAVLGLGRFFRVDKDAFVILGRDQDENDKLIRFAMPHDMILRSMSFPGPVALVRGHVPDASFALGTCPPISILSFAAGMVQFHSKSRSRDPLLVACWRANEPAAVRQIMAAPVNEADVKRRLL
jgi:hypothetical protein